MVKALSIGHKLNNEARSERYTITGIIGRGASTVAYSAMMDNGKYISTRILKEYCPSYIDLERTDDGTIECKKCDKARFEKGFIQFLASGERQNELREKTSLRNQTPPITDIFEAKNTAYLDVTPFEGKIFDNVEDFSLIERLEICLSIAKLANLYHREGYLCLDIKPSNVFVLNETTEIVEFIDFDSVREKNKISFGNSLSFTKSWAAPEQENPYSVDCISEATDVYSVGEIVFWTVFGRHSCVKEHRKNSRYPFFESHFEEVKRKPVRELLTNLFSNTIRSSADNRFSSMEPVIKLLEKVVYEVSKKEIINAYEIFSKDFFVGRNVELEVLDRTLQEQKIVFVSGVPGIGKSEIVKKYINIHREEYQDVLYWFYEGDFEKMICNDYSVSITNFKREQNEEDAEYSRRKLKKIAELVNDHTLIIIDNLDILVEDLNSPELWNKLKSFPGKLIVTTRCEQRNYETIRISEIEDIQILEDIFFKHCPSSFGISEELGYVDDIIESTNRHTYEIELLAAHAEAEKKSPHELLEDMKKCGIGSFDKTKIHVLKDGLDVSATFKDHLQKIFSLNSLSLSQKQLLLKLSLIPNGGVPARQFMLFYSMTDYNDLNWLISHGLVYETIDNRHFIAIHPSVAEMSVNVMRAEKDIIDNFFEEAFRAMRKGYDDESVNQEFLLRLYSYVKGSLRDKKVIKAYRDNNLGDEELKNRIDEMLKEFDEQYAKNDVDPKTYASLCTAVAFYSLKYQIKEEWAARYITQYVQWFMKYGQHKFQRELMIFAKEIYDEIDSESYFQNREYMCDVYVILLLKDEKFAQDVVNISSEHLKIAIKAKDWDFASKWCYSMAMAYHYLDDMVARVKYQMKGLGYSIKDVWFRKKRKHENCFMADKNFSATRSLWFSEMPYEECVGSPWSSIFSLRMAVYQRKSKSALQEMSDNEIKICIDKAKIKMLQYDFAGAKEEMVTVVQMYRQKEVGYTEGVFEAFKLLGEINTILKEFEEALSCYEECIKISNELDYQDVHAIQVLIGRIYNHMDKLDLSQKHNLRLMEELEEKDVEASKIVLADVYYNNAERCMLNGEYKEAEKYLDNAKSLYSYKEKLRTHCKIGKTRCEIMEAQILVTYYEIEKGKVLLQEGLETLENILGELHPEVLDLKNKI